MRSSAPLFTCLVDPQGRIVASNGSGHGLRELLGSPVVQSALADVFARGGAVEYTAEHAGGTSDRPPLTVHFMRLDGTSGPLALVTFHSREVEQILDALTGLPDRRAIADRVTRWRGVTGGAPIPFVVLFLDLDGFKEINDAHGHAVGDRILEELARRLVQCVRDEDLVARYGGDEFVLLLKDVGTAEAARPIIARLRQSVQRPFELGQLQLRVDATIGVAVPVNESQTVEDLIAAADRDMYAHKPRGSK